MSLTAQFNLLTQFLRPDPSLMMKESWPSRSDAMEQKPPQSNVYGRRYCTICEHYRPIFSNKSSENQTKKWRCQACATSYDKSKKDPED